MGKVIIKKSCFGGKNKMAQAQITTKKAEMEEKLNKLFEEVKDTFLRSPIDGPEIIWDKIDKSG